MEINENNISTVASMVFGVIIYPILLSFGVEIDQTLGTAIVGAIIMLCLLIWSAMNPNKMKLFGNQPVTQDEGILNDEYVTGDDNGK